MRSSPASEEHVRLRDGTAVRLRATATDSSAAIAARDVDGRTVGRASYTRVYGRRAELALDVEDDFWHRGLAKLLLVGLCVRAAEDRITSFLARAPASDMRLLALLREDFAARAMRDGAFVDVELSTSAPASGWTTELDARSSPMAEGAAGPTLAFMTISAPTFAQTRVSDAMCEPVITCGPETPIQLVAQTMADERVHAVVITGIERTAWGVVTALDVAAAAATEAVEDVARDVAATEPVTVSADARLPEAARVMAEHQVNHLLVVGADGRPAGILSTADIARRFAAAA